MMCKGAEKDIHFLTFSLGVTERNHHHHCARARAHTHTHTHTHTNTKRKKKKNRRKDTGRYYYHIEPAEQLSSRVSLFAS